MHKKILARHITLLCILGMTALGNQAWAATTTLGSRETVTFGGTESTDGTKRYVNDQNKLTLEYTASSISVSRGLKAIYQDGQNLVLNLGSVDTTSSRTTPLDEGTLKIQAVLANQLPDDIQWDSTANKYTLNKDGKIAAGDTSLVTGGTVYNTVGSLDVNGTYNVISAGNNISQNLIELDKHIAGSNLVTENGDTIHIGGSSSASTINVQNSNGQDRVISGVKTDASDRTSAANVGFVKDQLQNTEDRLKDDINRVGAGAAALAALHPLDYDPENKLEFAGGYGHYQGANAAAMAAFYHPDETVILSLGSTMGNGSPMVNAGVTFKLGPKGYTAMSRTALTKALHEEHDKNVALQSEVENLKQMVYKLMADKEGKTAK